MRDFWDFVGLALIVVATYVLLFGLTIDGKHHNVQCSEKQGIEFR